MANGWPEQQTPGHGLNGKARAQSEGVIERRIEWARCGAAGCDSWVMHRALGRCANHGARAPVIALTGCQMHGPRIEIEP